MKGSAGKGVRTGFNWGCEHRHERDEDGRHEVNGGEDQVYLDGTLHLGVLPAEIGNAENCQTNADLRRDNETKTFSN